MIKPLKAAFGLLTKVVNIKTKNNFIVSTVQNPSGVYETAVFKAPNLFILSIIANFIKPEFIVNSGNYEDAALKHTQICQLFEQLNPRELIRSYEENGTIGGIHLLSKEGKNSNKKYLILVGMVFLIFALSFISGVIDQHFPPFKNIEIPPVITIFHILESVIYIVFVFLLLYYDSKGSIFSSGLLFNVMIIAIFIFAPWYYFFKTKGFKIGAVCTAAYVAFMFLLFIFYYLGTNFGNGMNIIELLKGLNG